MSRLSFSALTMFNRPKGRVTHLVEVFDLSEEEQRDMFYKAILGYDNVHPDGPGEDALKFPKRVPQPPQEKP